MDSSRRRTKKNSPVWVSVFLLVALLGIAGSIQARQASPFSEATARFEKFASAQMALDRMPGLSIAFMKDGAVWARGFGFTDLENMVPAKPESAYRLASITKTITAFAVLQLVESGKIGLDAEIQAYVPAFPKKKWPVTVRELLGHLGGISHYRDSAAEEHFKEPMNTEQAIAVFKDFELVAEPGTRYNYSSYGFDLLGAAVERASGESYGDYIKKRIFAPLGMESSRMDDPLDVIPNRVRGYRLVDDVLKNSEFVDVSSRFAGGGTRSTVVDLMKFARGIIDARLVKRETEREMFASMAQRNGQLTGYGMGWEAKPWKGHFQVSHGGSQPETRTHILVFPAENFAVAAASNLEDADLMPYIKRLTELVLDESLDSAAYTAGRARQLIYDACDWTFSNGLSHFVWTGAGLARDGKDLAEAFAYFNQNVNELSLQTSFAQTKAKILAGIHPRANQALTKVGAYMASSLKESVGEEKLRGYTKSGPLAFFNDYIRLSRSGSGPGEAFSFGEDFVRLVSGWEKDWQKANTPAVRSLEITAASDFGEIGAALKSAFTGVSLYPDLTDAFAAAARSFIAKDDFPKAFLVLNLARDLYPGSPGAAAALASACVWAGKFDEAREHYRRVVALDSTHPAVGTAQWLLNIGQLERAKKWTQALALGLIALDYHPKDARLHSETANGYVMTGQKDKAAEYYKKALALDPNLEAAKKNLAKLENMK